MSAFGKSLWGAAADKTAEIVLGIGPLVAILVRNGFSFHRIMEAQGRYESGAIISTSFSALVVWHGFRSAYAVSREITERDKAVGFVSSASSIRLPSIKLYGIALSILILLGIGNISVWKIVIPKLDEVSSLNAKKSLAQDLNILSHDIFVFHADRDKSTPQPPFPARGMDLKAYSKLEDEYDNKRREYDNETFSQFQGMFHQRISIVIGHAEKEKIEAREIEGIKELCLSVNNSFILDRCGQAIGSLAGKIP